MKRIKTFTWHDGNKLRACCHEQGGWIPIQKESIRPDLHRCFEEISKTINIQTTVPHGWNLKIWGPVLENDASSFDLPIPIVCGKAAGPTLGMWAVVVQWQPLAVCMLIMLTACAWCNPSSWSSSRSWSLSSSSSCLSSPSLSSSSASTSPSSASCFFMDEIKPLQTYSVQVTWRPPLSGPRLQYSWLQSLIRPQHAPKDSLLKVVFLYDI